MTSNDFIVTWLTHCPKLRFASFVATPGPYPLVFRQIWEIFDPFYSFIFHEKFGTFLNFWVILARKKLLSFLGFSYPVFKRLDSARRRIYVLKKKCHNCVNLDLGATELPQPCVLPRLARSSPYGQIYHHCWEIKKKLKWLEKTFYTRSIALTANCIKTSDSCIYLLHHIV